MAGGLGSDGIAGWGVCMSPLQRGNLMVVRLLT